MSGTSLTDLLNSNGTLLLSLTDLLKLAAIEQTGETISINNLSTANGHIIDNGDGSWSFVPSYDWDGSLTVNFDVTASGTTTSYSQEVSAEDITASQSDTDILSGSNDRDYLTGTSGNDIIQGGTGADILSGGDGDDIFLATTGDGPDRFKGGEGTDTILGTGGDDTIEMFSFTGDNRVEVIDGDEGENVLSVKYSADFSDTELRNIDRIEGSDDRNYITGSSQDDTIDGGGGNDNLKGGDGDDVFLVNGKNDGTDIFQGDAGYDVIRGSEKDDDIGIYRYGGTSSVEEIDGGAGINTLNVYYSADFSNTELKNIHLIQGSGTNSYLTGSRGDDTIAGGGGSDRVWAGDGNDTLIYDLSANTGQTDYYDGGTGHDRAEIRLTAAEFSNPEIQAEIQAFLQSHEDGSLASTNNSYRFTAFNLDLKNIEQVDILVDGKSIFGNEAPIVTGMQEFQLQEDGSVLFTEADLLANVTDAEGDVLSVQNLTVHGGNLSDNGNGSWTFTPDADFNGRVTFSYQVSDGSEQVTATGNFNVEAVNDAAVVSGDVNLVMQEDGSIIITNDDLLANASDVDGDSLSVTGLNADQGSLTDNGDGSWTFTPDADFNGKIALSYQVSDGTALTTANATVNVAAVNDAAKVTGDIKLDMQEDGTILITSEELLANASDVDGDSLSVTGLSADRGNLTDHGDGTWTFTPDADFNGKIALSYQVSDGSTATAASATVEIAAVNDTAVVTGDIKLDMQEDGTITITSEELLANASDVDGDDLSVTGLSTSQGSLTDNGDGTWTFTPDADFNGKVALSYQVSDGAALTPAAATIEVYAVNDAAVVSGDVTVNMQEDGTITISSEDLLANASDVDGDDLTVTGLSTSQGSLTDNGDGTWTFTPNADFYGQVALSYQVSDGTVSTPATAKVMVASVNDAPEAGGQVAMTMDENGNLILTEAELLAGAYDLEGDFLSVVNLQSGIGSVTDNGDGTWTFTPPAGWSGELSLTYDIFDGISATPTTAQVTVEDLPDNIITGTAASETIIGSAGADLISGGKGNDVIFGGGGNDVFTAKTGEGYDRYSGGDGEDTLVGSGSDDTIELMSYGGDHEVEVIDGGAGENTIETKLNADFSNTELRNIDRIVGSSYNQSITGSAGDDVIEGGKGNDVLKGGAGDDVFLVNDGDGMDVISGGDGTDTILGGDGDDNISLRYFNEPDSVEVIDGGAGENTVSVNVSGDFSNTELRNIDRIVGSDYNNSIIGSAGDDVIVGGKGDDNLKGGAGDDIFLVSNGEGQDAISGGDGTDTILGSDGDDVIDLKYFNEVDGVEVIDGGAGTNSVSVRVSGDFSQTEMRNIDSISGSEYDNSIAGTDGDDTIFGLEGNDSLTGGKGDDYLDGGDGNDIASFAGNLSDYDFTFNNDGTITVTDTVGDSGSDTVANVEKLSFADTSVTASQSAIETALTGKAAAPAPGTDGPISDPVETPDTIIFNPEVIRGTDPEDVVGLRFDNNGSEVAGDGPITFGHVFKAGDIPAGTQLTATVNGVEVPVQMNVKATNDDGSVRHAILTVDSPAINPGEGLDIQLSKGTPSTAGTGSISPQDILDGGLDLTVDMSIQNDDGSTTAFQADAAQILAQAMQDGTVSTWIEGPLASEYTVKVPVNDQLDLTFNIRAFADGNVMTDVVFSADHAFTAGNDNITYDVTIKEGGDVAFAQQDLEHHHKGTWHTEVWSDGDPGINVVRDMDYFVETGALPQFDLSVGASEAAIQASYQELQASGTGPMTTGTVETNMPMAGGREDIGPLPSWTVRYLASQDETAAEIMYANADAAGSIPWHYRDDNTGEVISVDDYPDLWFDSRGGTSVLADEFSTDGTEWSTDVAHLPSLTYLPYLLSGSQYYLDELQASANHATAYVWPGWRGENGEIAGNFENGDIDWLDGEPATQTRAQAWGMREISDAAFIMPDDDPMKDYFENRLDVNLKSYVENYVNGTLQTGDNYGMLMGVGTTSTKLWMDDYFTMVLSTIAGRENGEGDANTFLEWKSNYNINRFLSEDFGLDPMASLQNVLGTFTYNDDGTRSVSQTWQEMFDATYTDNGLAVPDDASWYGATDNTAATSKFTLASLAGDGLKGALEAYGWVSSVYDIINDLYDTDPGFSPLLQLGEDGEIIKNADEHYGSEFNDQMTGTEANELLHGVDGDDFILGKGGADALFGGNGNDTIDGGTGNDFLFGNKGDDTLMGGDGDDEIKGGKGEDILTGGDGADTFIYDRISEAGDHITDFESGVDVLDLRELMNVVSEGATINLTQADNGTEIWLDVDNQNTLLLTLDGVNKDQINTETDIWM
ncbi:cadherin-like domain-containing protein [Aestuariispira insulae]|uniref:Ca2+-binding RTX toxin-like protein n=1 Tax=Aestuariispira insulae TaxID=1461337 RepID=A0A3D9HKC8_9PROT|nr:cadherin-like domain-containing protein [Aestuariispira insulae]RED49875.1 Ca2+-binding RTX toxin-like protein [Aestuariispira insulae]